MMNYADCMKAYENIDEWQVITSFSVGGFEWLGFSKEQPNKMLCISSQKTTIVDCESGEVEDVLNDLRKVSNPNFQDSQGTSYLHMACQAHSIEAISILLDLEADVNISDKRGFSPILSALGRINENNSTIFEMMLQHGLDLDKTEGEKTLKEQIESFNDEDLNAIIEKYYRK